MPRGVLLLCGQKGRIRLSGHWLDLLPDRAGAKFRPVRHHDGRSTFHNSENQSEWQATFSSDVSSKVCNRVFSRPNDPQRSGNSRYYVKVFQIKQAGNTASGGLSRPRVPRLWRNQSSGREVRDCGWCAVRRRRLATTAAPPLIFLSAIFLSLPLFHFPFRIVLKRTTGQPNTFFDDVSAIVDPSQLLTDAFLAKESLSARETYLPGGFYKRSGNRQRKRRLAAQVCAAREWGEALCVLIGYKAR